MGILGSYVRPVMAILYLIMEQKVRVTSTPMMMPKVVADRILSEKTFHQIHATNQGYHSLQ